LIFCINFIFLQKDVIMRCLFDIIIFFLGGYDMDSGSSPKNNFFKIKSNLEEKGDNYDYLLATN
jgi:hypothetical protein